MFLGLALVARPALANEALADKNGCTVCHKVNEKVIGPAYKDVSVKYKGDAKAAEMLFDKVKSGGAGVWGAIPMPPNVAVSDDDIKKLVAWILSLQ
jgi:cytochrome c